MYYSCEAAYACIPRPGSPRAHACNRLRHCHLFCPVAQPQPCAHLNCNGSVLLHQDNTGTSGVSITGDLQSQVNAPRGLINAVTLRPQRVCAIYGCNPMVLMPISTAQPTLNCLKEFARPDNNLSKAMPVMQSRVGGASKWQYGYPVMSTCNCTAGGRVPTICSHLSSDSIPILQQAH